MKFVSRAVLLALALIVAGCATPYQPSGVYGGYSERKIDDTTWLVRFQGNALRSLDEIYVFWLYRCAEVTVREGYTHFARVDRQAEANPGKQPMMAYRWSGPERKPVDPLVVQVRTVYVPIYGGSDMPAPLVEGIIKLYRSGSESSRADAKDAHAVLRQYATQVGREAPKQTADSEKAAVEASTTSDAKRGAAGSGRN